MPGRNAVAREVSGYDEAKRVGAGAFYFLQHEGERVGLIHACPCGCAAIGSLYWKNPTSGGANWTVTGEWPKATLSPSIGFRGGPDDAKGPDGFHWHGHLVDGVFVEC